MPSNRSKLWNRLWLYSLEFSSRKKNLALLKSYLKTQKNKMITDFYRTILSLSGWTISIGLLCYYAHQVNSQYHQINKMRDKLNRVYPEISKVQVDELGHQLFIVTPQSVEQLTNLVHKCWKYHFKLCVTGCSTHRVKHISSKQHLSKTLYVSLQRLIKFELDTINNQVQIGVGLTCQEVNKKLLRKGYNEIFYPEFAQQNIFEVINNNIPLKECCLNSKTINIELISAEGNNFKSANQVNLAGKIPNLNSLFIGTAGTLAIPTAIKLIVTPISNSYKPKQNYKIPLRNINQCILKLRKLNKQPSHKNNIKINFASNNLSQLEIQVNKENSLDLSQNFQAKHNINPPQPYEAIFSINLSILQKILLSPILFELSFQYANNILRVRTETSSAMQALVLSITLQNGVLVWHQDQTFTKAIKPAILSSQVGAQLMKQSVLVQKALDNRSILNSHSQYEKYFRKSKFRQITELFW